MTTLLILGILSGLFYGGYRMARPSPQYVDPETPDQQSCCDDDYGYDLTDDGASIFGTDEE